MKTLSLQEILTAVDGNLIHETVETDINGVSTDSRTIGSGDVFFALQGEKFDGHKYIGEVLENGCTLIVVSKVDAVPKVSTAGFILVADTLKAYQQLAKYYKQIISPVTIGITGSVGKTSLKDMVNTVSKDHYNTVCSYANENNHIGVPKTIFRMEENTEVLILEMGMSNKGEIDLLADIGRPDVACITNIGFSHIENFPDREGVFNAKMEITDYFSTKNTLVIMGDDPYLHKIEKNNKYKVISAGKSCDNDYIAEEARYIDDTHITFLIEYDKGVERFTLPIAGLYNSTTAALATAIMSELNISVTNCAHSLMKLTITKHRLQLLECNGLKIIDDTYNASPTSMKSAIEYLLAIEAERRIAILADMKELGNLSHKLHKEVGDMVAASEVDYLFTVGELGRELGDAASEKMGHDRVFSFDDKNACMNKVEKIIKKGDGILVKGSHSMEMEKIVDALCSR